MGSNESRPRIYLETTVVSYLAAWPSRDLIVAAHQEITHRWWRTSRLRFDLFASEPVIREASGGDPDAAARRLLFLERVPLLEMKPEVFSLASQIADAIQLPPQAKEDSLHLAVAAVHEIPYLLTWNCRHLANARLRDRIETACSAAGYRAPTISTPEELLDEAGYLD